MYCLDTNVNIFALNRRRARIAERLAEELAAGTRLIVPAAAMFELEYGIAKSARGPGARAPAAPSSAAIPALASELAREQARRIEVGVELRPVQADAGGGDFDFRQILRRRAGQPFGEAGGKVDRTSLLSVTTTRALRRS